MSVCGLFLAQARDPSPKHPDWLWGPPNLLFSGYQGFFSRTDRREYSGHGIKLTTHLHLVLR